MRKLNVSISPETVVYSGMFDVENNGKQIQFQIENQIITLDLSSAIQIGNPVINGLNVSELKVILSDLKLELTMFPTGNIHVQKQNSDLISTCYFSSDFDKKYYFIVAFDETQPTLYKAQLLGVFAND